MRVTANTDFEQNLHSAEVASLEQILQIDARLNQHIDQQRRQPLASILQGVVEIVSQQADVETVWIQFEGPRTFNGQPPVQQLLFSGSPSEPVEQAIGNQSQAIPTNRMEAHSLPKP